MKRRNPPRFTWDTRAGAPEPEHPRGYRGWVTAALGLFALVITAVSPVWWAPGHSVAGTAHAITSSSASAAPPPSAMHGSPSRKTSASPPRSSEHAETGTSRPSGSPGGQRPGTIRLPEGGTATLVREDVDSTTAVLPVPENLTEATWWGAGLGAEHGASVFAGHVNWGGRTGPFAELWHTTSGDSVTVVDDGGEKWRYDVSETRTLDKDELADEAVELFGQDERHRVVLVTCGGRWTGGDAGYAQNRVVIAHAAGH